MIQEIISLIANAILNKKKLRKQEWVEYDCLTRQILGFPAEQLIGMDMQELIGRYKGDPDEMGKNRTCCYEYAEIIRRYVFRSCPAKIQTPAGRSLVAQYVQEEGNTFSIQRTSLIKLLEING